MAEAVPDLLSAGPTADLRFRVRIEASGDLDAAERAALNELLNKVADGLKVT